jgi:hypothetical protein
VACDFGHHAILLDVKANFAKRGTPIQESAQKPQRCFLS